MTNLKTAMRKNSILHKIFGIQAILLISLLVVYIIITKIHLDSMKRYIFQREKKRFEQTADIIIKKEKESIENILNSYGMWKKLYTKVLLKDIKWLREQLQEDPQVNRNFDIYGIFLKNGAPLYGKGTQLLKNQARELINYFNNKYKIGDEIQEFLIQFVKTNKKIFLIGASPLCDDTNHILSFDIIFFGKSIDRILRSIKMFNPEVRLKDRNLTKGFIASIPVKNLKGQIIAYIAMPPPKYLEAELKKIKELKVILTSFLVIYLVLVYSILKFFQKEIEEKLLEMLEAANSIKEFRPNLEKIRNLSKKQDEIGTIAKTLLPVAEKIATSIIMDPLTEVYNRQYFFIKLKEELARAKRFKRNLSSAIFDVDDFKKINDTYGHAAGDEVLRKLSQTVKNNIRETDTLARIGGEEFGLILPETNIESAIIICERLRNIIEKMKFPTKMGKVSVTVSFGITSARETDTVETLYERADRALYMAKKAGKNKVISL